jgi:hypothetical protein
MDHSQARYLYKKNPTQYFPTKESVLYLSLPFFSLQGTLLEKNQTR